MVATNGCSGDRILSPLALRKVLGAPESYPGHSALWTVVERSSQLPLGIDLVANPRWRICQMVQGWEQIHPLGPKLFQELSRYQFQTRREALRALETLFDFHSA